METVNNLAGAAAKAIWGENQNQQEPISGEQGDTSKGEPFDKGNMEEEPTSTTSTTNLDAAASTSKGQDDVRDPSDPQTHPKNNPADVDDTGDGPNEPQKLDGPGPRPVEEVAKEHGGDAGNIDGATSSSADQPGDSDEPTDPNDPRAKSTGEGTGEQYVKSTGMAADGGDFDATKPGAGREADRLMEEKGMHRETGPAAAAAGKGGSDTSVNSSGSGEKKKLTTKIKEKFHRS